MNAHRDAFGDAVDRVLHRAADDGASDIHFEPTGDGLQIRIRVDGVMRTLLQVPDLARARRLMERVKERCAFDLGLIGVPQDSRFSSEFPAFDYRAALTPVMDGEKVVLRLLERDKDFSLGTYRMRSDAKRDLELALTRRDGLIVVSGPTGSGKSTLLYSALGELDRERLNVCTIEDPVEYRLPGLSQSQVNRAKGASFAGLLRSLMRADPDVILLGEIRDEETAEAALHAASTGHLVLTTVHANDSAEVASRLHGLGVKPALLASVTQFVSAQRLVPKLCPHCRCSDPSGVELVERLLGRTVERCLAATGCETCDGTGVAGRRLLFEWQTPVPGSSEMVCHDTLINEALVALNEGEIDARAAVGC